MVTHQVGRAIALVGLTPEVTAKLLALYSRSHGSVHEALRQAQAAGLSLPDGPPPSGEWARKFHERFVLGYGHKSVADHAMVSVALEGVSILAERALLDGRLLAASSKSTRALQFSAEQATVPPELKGCEDEYREHLRILVAAYQGLQEPAQQVIRALVPYDDQARRVWPSQTAWEGAIVKRALDMTRDLLPAGLHTSLGITMSATGWREWLDKRQGPEELAEIRDVAAEVREAARAVVPVLLPAEPRSWPGRLHTSPMPTWLTPQRLHRRAWSRLLQGPDWATVTAASGWRDDDIYLPHELVQRWVQERGHHQVPARDAELATWTFVVELPFAIQRDLGRHRMMTQLEDRLDPALGYGHDPLLARVQWRRHSGLKELALKHRLALGLNHKRLRRLFSYLLPQVGPKETGRVLQYACPLATHQRVTYHLNLRQLVHLAGLRTTPQGHPGYRQVTQGLAWQALLRDPVLWPLLGPVVNWEPIILGRPG